MRYYLARIRRHFHCLSHFCASWDFSKRKDGQIAFRTKILGCACPKLWWVAPGSEEQAEQILRDLNSK